MTNRTRKHIKTNRSGDVVKQGGGRNYDLSGGFTRLTPDKIWYCGKKKDECKCGTCDGTCGPTNGCPCQDGFALLDDSDQSKAGGPDGIKVGDSVQSKSDSSKTGVVEQDDGSCRLQFTVKRQNGDEERYVGTQRLILSRIQFNRVSTSKSASGRSSEVLMALRAQPRLS